MARGGRRRVTILGATGSIGRSTLDVLRAMGGREAFEVVALTGMSNIPALAAAAREFGAQLAVTADPARLDELRRALAGSGVRAAAGPEAVIEAAALPADWCMAAILGAAGLAPTLAALRASATVALANKECLVSAGDLFLAAQQAAGAALLPVDSEHNAIFQAMAGARAAQGVERVILTASGGPFRDWPRARMAAVTPEQAVAHPNWDMGAKISIDSASMFNKALEMIEARHLFALRPEQIEVLVHPQSIVHSMVGYRDGSILAQLGPPDMRVAIGYALGWPERPALPVERLDFAQLSRLDFAPPDEARFPALRLAREAMRAGGLAGATLLAAKEAALDAFIARRIGFLDMAAVVEETMSRLAPFAPATHLDEVFAADAEARRAAARIIDARAA
ncbi:1-deoxy-D-xylulose-5-phosphate reductoisomerase [Oceanicella actignis]|uniref:1-deoxy-D-xylulose 5-phosphate reductoisomerase n=1 Tax=Oceanicella actignis TaxID=1189325 RepID=A0A1M7U0F2_9RHOB|nr:1-deoxy-D-xylulose-5-phosphate reductoisomerase [Oceanicella actignis]TYO85002.1 1-deoxy-D-xylulose 5-phosphate reductoisomerase [Oceanicella actignis]SET84477.1 1-deoxy-D-xylulose 5-phosphate reductoisomerase [Oceanicella actignis]SHN76491.1 1-deoxy-D-xylulose 5-phosphate reductoisomerase [Oceanicella actignis]